MTQSAAPRTPAIAMAILAALPIMAGAQGRGPVTVPRGEAVAHDIRPGPGVTSRRMLSRYLPSLAGTPGDTPVYILDGGRPGGTVLVVGGTHGNEIAGAVAATVLIERARVAVGRLVVIPHANNSAASYRDRDPAGPLTVAVPTPAGPRLFRYGSRLTKPADQGELDPPRFRHPKSAEDLDGVEARNLDRVYPGRADGNLTERIAHAVMEVLAREQVDVAFDLHESRPESRLAWTVVAHPKNVEMAALALLALDARNVPMKLEQSGDSFRGLSHREWGDATRAQAYLIETPNPGQADKATGVDQVGDPRLPLARRVATHLATLLAVLDASNEGAPADRRITIDGVPSFDVLIRGGLGAVLR